MKKFFIIAAASAVSMTAIAGAAQADNDMGISADQVTPKMAAVVDQVHAKQAANRVEIVAMVTKARENGVAPKVVALVDRIQGLQAQNRKAIVALVNKAQELNVHPAVLAAQDPAYATVQLAKRQPVMSNEIDG